MKKEASYNMNYHVPGNTYKEMYKHQGYCLVRGVLSPSECASIQAIYEQAGELPTGRNIPEEWLEDSPLASPFPPVVRKIGKPFETSEDFRRIFSSKKVLDLVELFIGSEIYLHSSKLLYKAPRIGRRKPYHQDLAYWPDLSAAQTTLWCAIDNADKDNGCIELFPGSHQWGLISHNDLDDWQIPEQYLSREAATIIEMNEGDVLFLDELLVHASRKNISERGRLAAIVNYYSQPKSAQQTSKYVSTNALRSQYTYD